MHPHTIGQPRSRFEASRTARARRFHSISHRALTNWSVIRLHIPAFRRLRYQPHSSRRLLAHTLRGIDLCWTRSAGRSFRTHHRRQWLTFCESLPSVLEWDDDWRGFPVREREKIQIRSWNHKYHIRSHGGARVWGAEKFQQTKKRKNNALN